MSEQDVLIVQADSDNAVDEAPHEDDNTAVSQITMAWDIQAVNAGRIMFGLPSLDPRL